MAWKAAKYMVLTITRGRYISRHPALACLPAAPPRPLGQGRAGCGEPPSHPAYPPSPRSGEANAEGLVVLGRYALCSKQWEHDLRGTAR